MCGWFEALAWACRVFSRAFKLLRWSSQYRRVSSSRSTLRAGSASSRLRGKAAWIPASSFRAKSSACRQPGCCQNSSVPNASKVRANSKAPHSRPNRCRGKRSRRASSPGRRGDVDWLDWAGWLMACRSGWRPATSRVPLCGSGAWLLTWLAGWRAWLRPGRVPAAACVSSTACRLPPERSTGLWAG